MKRIEARTIRIAGYSFALCLMSLIAADSVSRSQAAESEAFEAATIRVARQGEGPRGCTGGPGTSDPTLWRCSEPLRFLISYAYKLQPYQFDPHGCCNVILDVTARVPAGASGDQFREMLRTLLTERLDLRLHYETREMPVFELTWGKRRLSITKSKSDRPTQEPPPWQAVDSKFDNQGCPIFSDGSPGIRPGLNGCYRWVAYGVTTGDIADALSVQVGRKVVDATGLSDRFDIDLKWRVDLAGTTEAPAGPDGPGLADAIRDKQRLELSLIKAIRDQLGLELVQKRGMADIAVIDHVSNAPVEQ